MKSKQQRNSYTKEFRLEAIHLTEESGKPSAQMARELGISANLLYSWRRQYKNKKESASIDESRLTAERQELKRLRLENARLREERDILKKSTAFFAREPKRSAHALLDTGSPIAQKHFVRC